MKTTDPVLACLYRLKARLGKERARHERWEAREQKAGDHDAAAMSAYRAGAFDLAMAFADVEIRRAKGQP